MRRGKISSGNFMPRRGLRPCVVPKSKNESVRSKFVFDEGLRHQRCLVSEQTFARQNATALIGPEFISLLVA